MYIYIIYIYIYIYIHIYIYIYRERERCIISPSSARPPGTRTGAGARHGTGINMIVETSNAK